MWPYDPGWNKPILSIWAGPSSFQWRNKVCELIDFLEVEYSFLCWNTTPGNPLLALTSQSPGVATHFLNGDTHLLPWPWSEIFKLHKFRLASNFFVGNHVGLHGSSLTVATQNIFVPDSCTTSQCKKYDNHAAPPSHCHYVTWIQWARLQRIEGQSRDHAINESVVMGSCLIKRAAFRGMFRIFQDDLDNANDRIIINSHDFGL